MSPPVVEANVSGSRSSQLLCSVPPSVPPIIHHTPHVKLITVGGGASLSPHMEEIDSAGVRKSESALEAADLHAG